VRGAVVVVDRRTVVGVVVTGGAVGVGDGAGAAVTGAAAGDCAGTCAAAEVDDPDALVEPEDAEGRAEDPPGVATAGTAGAMVVTGVAVVGSFAVDAPPVTSGSIVVGSLVGALSASAATIDAVAARLMPAVMARDAGATCFDDRRFGAPAARVDRDAAPSVIVLVLVVVLVVVLIVVVLVVLVVLVVPVLVLAVPAVIGGTGPRIGNGRCHGG